MVVYPALHVCDCHAHLYDFLESRLHLRAQLWSMQEQSYPVIICAGQGESLTGCPLLGHHQIDGLLRGDLDFEAVQLSGTLGRLDR